MEGGKEGPGEEERTERRDETGLFHLEKGCVWRQRRRGGDKRTGGRLRGGKDGEEEAPVLSGAVCVCLYVCSHTVEINLPSGLSLWNKERRKLARSDTLREKWRKTRQAQGGRVEFRRYVGGGREIYLAPPTTPNTPAMIRKIRLLIPSSTLFNPDQCIGWILMPTSSSFSKYLSVAEKLTKPKKLELMRKSSHLLSWRDVVSD